MASISEALKIVFKLEHGSNEKALHKNPTENGLTFCGIYEEANPNWIMWKKIKEVFEANNNDYKKSSLELMNMCDVINAVEILYKDKYWDSFKGNEIVSQHIANEIMVFAVNVGTRNAIKTAQRCIGVSADGIFGNKTLEAINKFDENKFDMLFDDLEKSYYKALADKNPKFSFYIKGWNNRAEIV